ncbi:MAG TPA: PTS sugar transporter subunit IIA [Anaeromyxobacteraceae bacterium]|nr:PTS sugar transporter subunit IIA [Anaeromyxobacteraceae bacterium]
MQLTVREAARHLGVTEQALLRWAERGELPAQRVNGQYRFNRVELLEWAAERRLPVAPEILEEPGAVSPRISLSAAVRAGGVHPGVPGTDRETILRAVVDRLPLPPGADRALLLDTLLARERLGSTAVGGGFAIPHPREPIVLRVRAPALAVCYLESPADFDAPDGRPVETLFVLITPSVRDHLHLLASLAAALRDPALRERLSARAGLEALLNQLERLEREQAARRARALERKDRE